MRRSETWLAGKKGRARALMATSALAVFLTRPQAEYQIGARPVY
ncbi:hypothetical protein U91I_01855 [alpha proteobacterium U9-1i]|nr:hypothetical protein U91I_01855 [alpha proteobacterium U9-1i]